MFSRTLAMIFVGAAVAFAAPLASAETISPVTTASVSPADNPAPAKPAKKKTVKKSTKTKVVKKVEPEKPKGLFASLFKPAEPAKPAKPLTKAEKAAAAKAAKLAAAKEKADKAKAEKTAAAAAKAEKVRLAKLAEDKARAEEAQVLAIAARAKSNTGQLRSDGNVPTDFFSSVFGAKPKVLEETKALDAVLSVKEKKKGKFRVKPDFEPHSVDFPGYSRGQIVIDTGAKYLYLVESSSTARRYAIAVGREGLEFKGKATVGDKQEWPRWFPTADMQKRDPAKYGIYPEGMDGGPDNPLGARAIYLFQGKKDTHIRIHGTNQPQSIGTSASNGCFRMINEHVIELYSKVKVGTEVIVL